MSALIFCIFMHFLSDIPHFQRLVWLIFVAKKQEYDAFIFAHITFIKRHSNQTNQSNVTWTFYFVQEHNLIAKNIFGVNVRRHLENIFQNQSF